MIAKSILKFGLITKIFLKSLKNAIERKLPDGFEAESLLPRNKPP